MRLEQVYMLVSKRAANSQGNLCLWGWERSLMEKGPKGGLMGSGALTSQLICSLLTVRLFFNHGPIIMCV